ncbi:MAG: TolC family protein [Desulfobulbaceae bacterium]|nr:TolC family protein [Desulfobulbaceae bacterium]
MIDRFRGDKCCVLVLILQLVLSPIATTAAAEMPDGSAGLKPASSGDFALETPSVQNIPPQGTDSSTDSLPPQKIDAFQQIADGFVMPGKQNLAELIGRSEISVLADVDGQFVKSMTAIQMTGEDFARLVDETNFLESIRAGRNFNRTSLAALARTEQAKAQTGQAFALMLPSVSVRASHGEETSKPSVVVDETTGELSPSDTHLRTDATLTVRQPLFNLPLFMDWRRRKVKEQAREEDYRVSDGDAYISTVNAYLSLVSSRLQADITRDFETQLAELLSYIEKRASAGAASISDMSRVRARSQATMSSLLEQESAHAAAGIEFVRLTNLVPRKISLPALEDVGASLLPETFELAVATAIKANPEITALTAELQAAKIDQTAAKGRYLPRVDAEYTDTYALHAGGDLSTSGQRDERLMMVLNWDLFSGGRDYKYRVELTARHKELQYRLDDQRRKIVQALSANYAGLATTRERITSGYQELKSISTAAEAMSKRMLSGNQSLLDLLTVYDRYYQVRTRLVNLHILEMNMVAQLVRFTLGTPWAAAEGTPAAADQDQISPIFNDPFWDQGVWYESL